MGEPASILDMARQMIRLSGLRPDEDIEIKVTGRRRGERLIEKLHDDNEIIGSTSHPSIASVTPKADFEPGELFDSLRMLDGSCAEANDVASIRLLERLLQRCGVGCELTYDRPSDVTLQDEGLASPPTGDVAAMSALDAARS
jgi:FlaA1/EpsC-like NDP-sugar epimerase